MRDTNEDHSSSDRILKSKYGAKTKSKMQTVHRNVSSKIMIADLCAQEKLKIGELIKINQNRRIQIEELTQENQLARAKIADLDIQLIQLRDLVGVQQKENQQLSHNLNKYQSLYNEIEVSVQKLLKDNQTLRDELAKSDEKETFSRSVQTQERGKNSQGTQTKKLKTKQRHVQAEVKEAPIEARPTQRITHSKSFETVGQSKWTPKLRNSSQRQSLNSEHESCEQERQQDRAGRLKEDVEQCFQDLTRKWLELKEKNLSKLKFQYQQSRQKFYEEPVIATFQPKKITEDDLLLTEKEDQNDLDDVELNRLLKSSNFSASRLLTKAGMGQSQNQRKKSYYVDSLQTQQTKIDKLRSMPQPTKTYPLKVKARAPELKKGEGSVRVFEDEDFMDLIDSLV